MAITLRGSAHPFANGSTGTSISIPSNSITGLAANDVVVIGFYIDTNNVTITPPSGWTLIDNQNQSAGPYNQVEYYHVVTGSEPTNWTWTLGSSVFWDAELIAFTGCNTTTPLDAHTITTSNVGSSLTYNGADAVILFNINYSGSAVSATGFTMVQNGDGLGLGYVIETASGSTGSVTVSGGGGAQTTGLIALSPSGGATHSLGTVARSTFAVRAGLAGQSRGKFFTRTSLKTIARSTFLTRISLSGQIRDTFQIAAKLATTARSTFLTRIGLQTTARTRFFTKTALAQVAQATFKIASNLKSLGVVARTRFVTRAGLSTTARSTFSTRIPLAGQARGTFSTRIPLAVAAKTQFYTRIALQTVARSRFILSLFLSGQARSTFKIQALVVPGALKGAFVSISRFLATITDTSRYSAKFTAASRLSATFSVVTTRYIASFLSGSRLKASFRRSVTMAQPYSTVDVTATITKSDNSVPTASTLTVSVLFPDGTNSSYALPTDITSLGNGQYKLTYVTKGPGPHKETWTFTATDNSVGEFENTTYVSF